MNVVCYQRVSGISQADGDGPHRQADANKAFCKSHGLNIVQFFFEMGVSGTVEGVDRPQFSEALEFIAKHGDIKAIVVERMDRLARDLMVSEMLLKICRENHIKVFSADQGNLIDMASDGGDPTRVLIRQIMGALAQWEKSVLVKKMRLAKERMKASGVPKAYVEGVKPYGFFGPEKVIVELMRKLHEEGKNFSEIARLLESMDCRTRSGRPFKPQNVRGIILQPKKKNNESIIHIRSQPEGQQVQQSC